jgi:hypothetical protein
MVIVAASLTRFGCRNGKTAEGTVVFSASHMHTKPKAFLFVCHYPNSILGLSFFFTRWLELDREVNWSAGIEKSGISWQ